MIELLRLVVLLGALAWLWSRIEPMLAKGLALAERKLDLAEVDIKRPGPEGMDAPPADLIQFANSEATGWAKEDSIKYLFEMRERLGSWDAVRNIYLS